MVALDEISQTDEVALLRDENPVQESVCDFDFLRFRVRGLVVVDADHGCSLSCLGLGIDCRSATEFGSFVLHIVARRIVCLLFAWPQSLPSRMFVRYQTCKSHASCKSWVIGKPYAVR